MTAKKTPTHELVVERTLDAAREMVWRAWTDAKHVARWWGPDGFSTRVEQLDLRVGGSWRYVMVGPDGTEYPVEGVFREIVVNERIVTTDEFAEDFEFADPEDLPRGTVVTAIFAAVAARQTRLTLRIAHPTAEDQRKHEELGVVEGWESTLDCLEGHLAKR